MRQVARFSVLGTLALSCSFDAIGGPPTLPACTTPADTSFAVGEWLPNPLHLSLLSAAHVQANFLAIDCHQVATPIPGIVTWTLRDTSVASLTTVFPNENQTFNGKFVMPRKSGRTYVVASAQGRSDSLLVSVLDSVPMGPVTWLAAGSDVSCAVTENQVAMCWGLVPRGPPSDSTIGTCMGAPCSPMPIPVKSGARSVHAGDWHACVLDTNGHAWCWGSVPERGKVPGDVAFATLALGRSHSCGLTADSTAFCWGSGSDGQLGTGSRTNSIGAPTAVVGNESWSSLASHGVRTCGVTGSGELRCWGLLGNSGVAVPGALACSYSTQDKNGNTTTYTQPCTPAPLRMPLIRTGTDSLFAQVSGPCALSSGGRVFCHDPLRGVFAEQVGVGPFTSITTSELHGCGLDASGTAWCWGANHAGQLGDGSTNFRNTPVRVGTSLAFVQLVAGRDHTCGLTTSREVWCWGSNYVGQAGVSIALQPRQPTRVRGQR